MVDWGGGLTPYENDVYALHERQYLDDIFMEKKKEKKLPKAKEGRDYIKIFESKNKRGKEYLYLPLTWLGSKELASNLFAPKIKIAPEEVNYEPSAGYIAFDEESSTRAHWDFSIWSYPDLIGEDGEIFKDLKGNELRHEGKGPWLESTYSGEYYLFYFRDYDNLEDKYKKIAFILSQGSSKIEWTSLANGDSGETTPAIDRIQSYWDENYEDYESLISNIQEVAKEEYPKFSEYEGQKAEDAMEYHKSHEKEYTFIEKLVYNEETGRYDSKESRKGELDGDIDRKTLEYFVKNGEFTIPFGVIIGDFDCSDLNLKTLKNGPTEVIGDFDCGGNRLTSLKYAPKKVGGDFKCFYNKLTTLEGSPEYVGEYYWCNHNQLTTLKGAPKKIGMGSFYCDDNNLTTLEGAPEYVAVTFDCSKNKLKTLEGAPEHIGGAFYYDDNPLEWDDEDIE